MQITLSRGFEMFERFALESRRALFFARVAVSEHGGTTLGDAHLLLGILQVAPTEILRLVEAEGLVQTLAECLVGHVAAPEHVAEGVEVALEEGTKRVLHEAVEAADELGHAEVLPKHLLLALMRDDTSPAVACLRHVGLAPVVVSEAIRNERAG